ncbi:MAG: translation elongation factor Ts [Bacteroidota bacterium]
MAITAKQVNELRQATGAGMMDCKKALVEAEGDIEKAIKILREKGQKVSSKRADREANEGAVFIAANEDNTYAALIELNCETDFVARNEDFQKLGQEIAAVALADRPADLDGLKGLSIAEGQIGEALTNAMGKIGEKIDLSKYETVSGDSVVTYIHPGARIGVAVAFANVDGGDVPAVGKDVAMQIAAMNPVSISKDDVSEEVKEREMEIGRNQARNEGKPENIIDKIAFGKLNKFFKENTLLSQAFVKDTSKNVGKHITEHLGKDATVSAFKRVQLGAN